MVLPRSRMKRLMAKKSTKQFVPRRKLPKGMKVRGGFTAAMPIRRRTINDPTDLVGKFMDSAKEKGADIANDFVSKMAKQAIDAAGDAATAAATKGAAKAKDFIKEKLGTGGATAKGPTKVFTDNPTVSSTTLTVGQRKINNSIVPDKDFKVSLIHGKMTSREEKFYKRWPLQNLLIYQSKVSGRMIHEVSPGNKSFYYPHITNPLVPSWGLLPDYRKGVELLTPAAGSGPTTEPPFLPGNVEYGTVQGGLDYTYPLTLGTFSDYASCLSALLPSSVSTIPSGFRIGVGNKLMFGIPKMCLSFHIENQNQFLPAQFTVQVHEYVGQDNSAGGLDEVNPLTTIFGSVQGTVPLYARSFQTTGSVMVPSSGGIISSYTKEQSLLYNAPTFGGNQLHRQQWKIVASQKIRATAGGRVKCKIDLDLAPFDAIPWLQLFQAPAYGVRQRQLFVTILAQGTQEVYGDVYRNGDFQYSANFMTNPVQYTVSNIEKTAKVYAPQLNINVAGTAGFDQANIQFDNYVNDLMAYGESKVTQFVPVGQYDQPYENLVDADNIPASGPALVISVMSNQQKSSAGSRRD